MTKRRRHRPDPMESGEKHSRCPWDGLTANDELVSRHWSSEQIQQQRLRFRRLVNGDDWQEMFGSK